MIKFFKTIRYWKDCTCSYWKDCTCSYWMLIVLSINTWNEERKNTIKETTILKVIKLEFEANRERLVILMNSHKYTTESGFVLSSYFK